MTDTENGGAPAGRVTMKDIAARLGVSINTVHKAISGKPGVSDAVRERILAMASELGYRRNEGASNLSRKDVRAVVCLPSPQREGSYFYAYLWEGCERYVRESRDSGLAFERMEFGLGEYARSLEGVLGRLEAGEAIGGLLAYAPSSAEERGLLARIADAGCKVVLVDGDCAQTGRVGASISDYRAAGELMAEQTLNLLACEKDPCVLLLSGEASTDSHRLVAQAFREGVATGLPSARIVELPGAHARTLELEIALETALGCEGAQLACSVSAVGTEVLAETLAARGDARVRAIGNDLFPGSAGALRSGVLTNLVYKDPVGMAYRAAEMLGDCLLWGKVPEKPVLMGSVQLVFRSNLAQYCAAAGVEERPAAARVARR